MRRLIKATGIITLVLTAVFTAILVAVMVSPFIAILLCFALVWIFLGQDDDPGGDGKSGS